VYVKRSASALCEALAGEHGLQASDSSLCRPHHTTRSSSGRNMNPYAANFQVPVSATAPAGGDGEQDSAAWAEDPDQGVDGAGGYWDENGQHHPGYDGSYDPAGYHPDGYEPVYHQVCHVGPPRRRQRRGRKTKPPAVRPMLAN